ncbi:glycosyltransferase [Donghicola sp. XS_ASV15]|uniref:glycosyltransferase n=1 Tax=Donghicola sp. XS_ASV15 TaxID=3241295 RepID=UPI00351700F5
MARPADILGQQGKSLSMPKKRMNIATSCNDRYARLVFVNLLNIHEILCQTYDVHFYLMQSEISEPTLAALTDFADGLDLTFYNVHVTERAMFESMSRYARAPDIERFFDAACHLFLPKDIDRVLYVDTGDVLFLSDDYGFYFRDFKDKSLLVTTYWRLPEDPLDFDQFQHLGGGFNSGHILINLERLRARGLRPQHYANYVERWAAHIPGKEVLYVGDQGFLTAFFAGEIGKIKKKNRYNVKVVDLNGQTPDMNPKSIHLNAMFGNIKPWQVPFTSPQDLDRLELAVETINPKTQTPQRYFTGYENSCILTWWDFCARTPVYEELKRKSLRDMTLLRLMSQRISTQASALRDLIT